MRHLRVFSSCVLLALFASACSKPSGDNAAVDPSDTDDVAIETDDVAIQETDAFLDDATGDVSVEVVDAEVVLANALAQAQSDDKNVFIHLGAPW